MRRRCGITKKKDFDGLDTEGWGDQLPANFADHLSDPVPALLDAPRTLDPTEYGPAVLQALCLAAFSDPGEYLSWGEHGGIRIKDSESLSVIQRRLIKEISEDKDGNIKIKFVDKDNALKLLGQASGVIVEHKHLSGSVDIGLLDVLNSIDGKTKSLPEPKIIEHE